MKDRLILVGVVLVALVGAILFVRLEHRKGFGLKLDEPAPLFRLDKLTGGQAGLEDLRGQVVLVNLWATWCPPCLEEMPSLQRLHQRLKADGLVVLGIAADSEDSDIKRVVGEKAITFEILRDSQGVMAESYHATGYPETFLVDRRGVLREAFVGPVDWDAADVTARIRALLDERT